MGTQTRDGIPRFGRGTVVALALTCAASIVGHLAVYPWLPARIPSHWDAGGNVDATSPKQVELLLDLLPVALLALFWAVPRLDPKGRSYRDFWGFYQGFVIAFTAFMCALSWMGDLTALGVLPKRGFTGAVVPVAVGALFVGIGNYMPRVSRNYSFGVKTPWALADPVVWQKSQRMGGRTFVVMGVGLVALGVLAPLMPDAAVLAVLLALVIGGSAWTVLYSYLAWLRR
jgi:uncharacterized membrane protein